MAGLLRGSICSKRALGSIPAFVCALVLISVPCLPAQENSKPLTPSEAYKAALLPVTEARSQANDLTDADKFALGMGIAQASRDCLALSNDVSSLSGNATELFALGQLCVFGQQFEFARAALVDYLGLPQPSQREQALLLLVRAYLGLKEGYSAEPQVQTLVRDYPYDARIHAAIDQVIDGIEGLDLDQNKMALDLCATQGSFTLPLLAAGKGLEGKDGSASAATLFADAVRCAGLAKAAGKTDNLGQLAAIAQLPAWAGTADLAPMLAALARQQMVGNRAPSLWLHGFVLTPTQVVPKAVSLKRGTVLLVPFTLWAPSTPDVARELAQLIPQPIYAITSWHANTGRADMQSPDLLAALRSWQRGFPRKVSILVVPDSVLSEFHSDVFPGAILIRNGTVLSNLSLIGEGGERLVANASSGKENPK